MQQFSFRFALIFSLLVCLVGADSEYHEQLLLRPLPPSSLLASFNFRSNTSTEAFEQQNFRYFPRSLGQILQHAGTKELHLRFGLGRWDAESWGARPWDGQKEGGTGVELWAWVDAETDEGAIGRWLTLTNALSGLFCASLNFVDSTRTTRPVMSFQPANGHSDDAIPNLHLLHGTLPREVVCTENLTPFLKLLPCKGKAGISSLLDGHKLFDASWQSMSIDVEPVCASDSGDCVFQITQTIDMVLDIPRSKRPRDNPIPRPVATEDLICDTSRPYSSPDICYPLEAAHDQDWSLSQIFGHSMKGICPLSDPNTHPICIAVPNSRDVYTSGGANETKLPSENLRCFSLTENNPFEMFLPSQDPLPPPSPHEEPLLYADRSFSGHGQERGGVKAILTNPSPDSAVDFIYMESLPWFMKVYLHTLEVKLAATPASHSGNTSAAGDEDIIQEMYYRPALDRHRGTQLEILMRLPPSSSAVLTYSFDKAILRYTEYPPDANRGFDVPPAIINILSPLSEASEPAAAAAAATAAAAAARADAKISSATARRTIAALRTTTLLLPLPTPDFSMPYNVIILTSTVMALAFGNVFNLLVRRFVAADETESFKIGDLLKTAVARAKLEAMRVKNRLGAGKNAAARAKEKDGTGKVE